MSEPVLSLVEQLSLDELSDEQIAQLAVEAQEWAEEAEGEAGSPSRWTMADSYAELHKRGWTYKRIGTKCGMSFSNVRYYVWAADLHQGANRPTFAFAYENVKGEKLDPLHSSESDEWETPQDLYDELDAEFGFTLDVCADRDNAKAGRFFTKDEDGLSQSWDGVCWMNPPYSGIDKWMAKAYESARDNGATVVCLVPGRTDTAWAWDFCRFGEIRLLRGRLKFGGAKNSAPFPSVVVVFPHDPQVIWWERT